MTSIKYNLNGVFRCNVAFLSPYPEADYLLEEDKKKLKSRGKGNSGKARNIPDIGLCKIDFLHLI